MDRDKDKQREEQWDEGALVLACLAKEREAQTTLVLGYAEWVHIGAVKAYRKAGRGASCEPLDLVHKFFLEIFTNPDSVLGRFDKEKGKLGPFLAGVSNNRSLKMLGKDDLNWPGRVISGQTMDISAIPDHAHTVPLDPNDVLKRILAELSETSQEIYQMYHGIGRYGVQHKARQIAMKLNLTIDQVYYRLNRSDCLRRRVIASLVDGSDDFS